MRSFFTFLQENKEKLWEQLLEHIGITFLSILIAILIAIPLGILIARRTKLAPSLLGFAGILQTIPSIALLGFLLPVLGIGVKPAIFALFLYALLPILRNTYTGITEVDDAVIEAAKGMGLTQTQILRQVELPLALPVIFAGIRTATVINVGIATLAAYIGAGGLGEFIFGGIALNNSTMILAGAIPAALLAVFFDQLLAWLQRLPARKIKKAATAGAGFLLLVTTFIFFPSFTNKQIKAAFDPEFYGRDDGYKGLRQKYDQLDFNTIILNASLLYKAVDQGKIDIISGYSTDGRIKAYDLVTLEDTRHVFPPYFCAPLLNGQTDQDYPEVRITLDLLAGQIDDALMTALNYQVDFEKKSPEEVAQQFLKQKKLWKPDQKTGGHTLVIGSKIFTEQYILAEIFAQLINGYTDLDVAIKTGLGGTKICFEALKQGEIDIYPEYTGTGFMVILQPEEQIVEQKIADPAAVYQYVSDAFIEKHNIHWLAPLGFNNSYALMTPRKKAKKEQWRTIEDL